MSLRTRYGLLVAAVLMLATLAGVGYYVISINRQYDKARSQADLVRSRLDSQDGRPSLSVLPQLTDDLNQLEADLHELDRRVNRPLIGGIARNAPFVGDQVNASQQLLDLGIELTQISRITSEIANEIRTAFEANGFMGGDPAIGPTWLDAVGARQGDIYDLERRYDVALQRRAELEVDELPDRARNTLSTVDRLLVRGTEIRDQYFYLFPLLDTAFGADEDAHYLILLQNGQELRQAGGFVGTYGMMTISNGRILELEINPISTLNQAYAEARTEVLLAPAPIREYLGQQEWFPHDANWSADFPLVAQELNDMYEDTGWPQLQGIVAVNDSAVQAVLEIIGPYEIEVDGQTVEVAPESFIDLIQSFRGHGEQRHKQFVADLGASLIEQVIEADFDTKKDIFWAMRDSANVREIQVAMLDPGMQAEVADRGWDGSLYPVPELSTLAVTISNITGNKASDKVWVNVHLDVAMSGGENSRRLKWTIALSHTGDPQGSREYNGFHRTWLQIYLPDEATIVSSSWDPAPDEMTNDPRAIGYHRELYTGEQETLIIEFDLPVTTNELLLRRQSGLHNIEYSITGEVGLDCVFDDRLHLDHDYMVHLDACEVTLQSGNKRDAIR